MPLARRPDDDRSRLVSGTLDADVQPFAGQHRPQAVGPLDERDSTGLALVEEAAGQHVFGRREAVKVDVEQRQSAGVFGPDSRFMVIAMPASEACCTPIKLYAPYGHTMARGLTWISRSISAAFPDMSSLMRRAYSASLSYAFFCGQ